MERVYNKLVRDNIPDIIRSNKETPVTRILNDEEYKSALEKKLYEEYNEVISSAGFDRVEELSDMLEVIESLAKLENSSLEEVIKTAKDKSNKRGSFNKKIFLEKVIEEEK